VSLPTLDKKKMGWREDRIAVPIAAILVAPPKLSDDPFFLRADAYHLSLAKAGQPPGIDTAALPPRQLPLEMIVAVALRRTTASILARRSFSLEGLFT